MDLSLTWKTLMIWLDYCFYSQLLVFVEQNDTTRQCHSVKNTLCTLFYHIFFNKKSNNELSSNVFDLCVILADGKVN